MEGESDKLAFELVIRMLEDRDPTWGGALISHLGGMGSVWDASQKVLKEHVDLVKRIVPAGTCVILLDRDGRPEPEVRKLQESLKDLGERVEFLKETELEDYWFEQPTLLALFRGLATEAWAAAHSVAMPTQKDVARASADPKETKAFRKLEEIARRLNVRFDKVPAARHAAAALGRDSGAMSALSDEVNRAMSPEPSRGTLTAS